MTSINEKLGLKPAGKRRRLQCLSGVGCPGCPHHYITETEVHGVIVWMCGFCGYQWRPTDKEIAQLRNVE